MENKSTLLRNANFIAATISLFFAIVSLSIKHYEELYILLGFVGIFLLSSWIGHKRLLELSKWIFVLSANAAIFIFDGGFYSNSPSYLLMIPLIMSYFVLNSYPAELYKSFFFIAISVIVMILVNLTDFSPKVNAERLQNELITDFFASLAASIAMVIILLRHYRRKHTQLDSIAERTNILSIQLQAIIDSGLNQVFLLDKNRKIILCDSNTKRMFRENLGIDLNSPGLILEEAFPEDLRADFIRNFDVALTGKTVRTERKTTFGQSDEKWYDVVYKPVKIPSHEGMPQYVIFAWHDITEMMKAKVSLENSERLIKSINHNIREGIYRSTIQDGWIYANQAFAEMMGYQTSEELYGKDPAIMYVHLHDRQELIRNVRDKGFFNSKDVELKRQDGSTFWASVSCMLSHNENGDEVFDVAVRDVTEQKQAEAEVIRQKEMAEAASKAKADFLSVMSHEIRTPMNAILGFTNIILEAEYLKEEDRENLRAIEHSAENLLAIINDILDFSKIEAGKITIEKDKFNIRSLLKELNQTTSFIAHNKDLMMQFEIDPRTPEFVIGDAVRVNQILLNLCGNAIKFTSQGGIRVSAYVREIRGKNITMEFVVKDSGIGIPEDKIDDIFESFTQADPHISRRFGGTGLGLTISKRLVELMGGNIDVFSEEGRGSEFKVTLNFLMSTSPTPEQKAAAGPRLHDLTGYHFLLVEDNKMNIMLASQLLRKWKATFDVAENGLEATDLLNRNEYDLVLLDLQLPYKSGFEVFSEMKSDRSTVRSKNIPVIALTADAFEETRDRVFKSGMNDMATKPFDSETLYDKISLWLKK